MLNLKTVYLFAACRHKKSRVGFFPVGQHHQALALKEAEGSVDLAHRESVCVAELLEVEIESTVGTTANRDTAVVAQCAVNIADIIHRRIVGLQRTVHTLPSVRTPKQKSLCRITVAARPTGFLKIGFQRIGHIHVNDKAHIGLVDAHAEGVGGNHHAAFAFHPPLLTAVAFG